MEQFERWAAGSPFRNPLDCFYSINRNQSGLGQEWSGAELVVALGLSDKNGFGLQVSCVFVGSTE